MSSKIAVRTGSLSICLLALASVSACTSSADTGANGAPVTGVADTHCGTKTQVVDPATCHAAAADAGPPAADAGPEEDEYGPTLNNAEGDDDQCKYHAKWTVAGARNGGEATFTLTATSKADGKPLTGAIPRAEVFLDETHPAPNTDQKFKETSPGTYTVGPIKFDAPGKWTVRFHFFEDCNDGDESPHGHVAFFVSVP
jgi:YtkA-like